MIFAHLPMRNGVRGPRVFRNSNFTHSMADSEREFRAFVRDVGLPENWPGTRARRAFTSTCRASGSTSSCTIPK